MKVLEGRKVFFFLHLETTCLHLGMWLMMAHLDNSGVNGLDLSDETQVRAGRASHDELAVFAPHIPTALPPAWLMSETRDLFTFPNQHHLDHFHRQARPRRAARS